MKLFLKPIISLIGCLLIASAHAGPTGYEDWTSTAGTKVTARAMKIVGNKVVLERINGKQITVPLNKLVKADQEKLTAHFKLNTGPPKATDLDKKDVDDNKGDVGKIKKGAIEQKDIDGKPIYLPYELGKEKVNIELDDNLKISIYVPSNLRAGEKYPLLFIADPYKGSPSMLGKWKSGAEAQGMILATLHKIHTKDPEPKNKRLDIDEIRIKPYIYQALRQLRLDFPIDNRRVYFTGYGNATFVAYYAMSQFNGAGVLAVNGGSMDRYYPSQRQSVVTLCGIRSKKRWDIACTLKVIRSNKLSEIYFYDSANWPSNNEISDGVARLNGIFLLKHKSGAHETAAKRYEEHLMKNIVEDGDGKDLLWVQFADKYGVSDKNLEKVEKAMESILKTEEGAVSKGGTKDAIKALIRHFATAINGYQSDNGKGTIKSALERLAKAYEETYWEHIFEGLSKEAS